MTALDAGDRHERPPATDILGERIATNDPDECAMRMRALGVSVRHYQMSSGSYAAAIDTVRLPGLRISLTRYGTAITARGTPPAAAYALTLPISPIGGTFLDNRPLPRDAVRLVRPAEEFQFVRPAGFQCAIVFPDAAAIDRLADAMFGRSFSRLVGGHRDLVASGDAIAHAAAQIAQLCRDWGHVRAPSAAAAKVHAAQLSRAVIDTMLGIVRPPEPVHGWSARERVVRKAWEIVDGDDDGAITVSELCVRLGVPIRSLDDAFRSCLGMNPRRFILGVRLNKVRQRLVHPSDATTVSSAAMDLGFLHFGHFAAHYHRLFGEAPSHTLRRARA